MAKPRGMWDLSSLTRDWPYTPCIGRQSQPLNCWGSSSCIFKVIICLEMNAPKINYCQNLWSLVLIWFLRPCGLKHFLYSWGQEEGECGQSQHQNWNAAAGLLIINHTALLPPCISILTMHMELLRVALTLFKQGGRGRSFSMLITNNNSVFSSIIGKSHWNHQSALTSLFVVTHFVSLWKWTNKRVHK